MLAIRLQRIGRSGYPLYRIVVQDSRRHPSSGRLVASLGSYNPHTKESKVNKEESQKFLDNGAQPSPRVVKLLKDAGVKLPEWVKEFAADQKKAIRNPEKLRKNQPKEETVVEEVAAEEPAVEVDATVEAVEAEPVAETESPAEEPTEA